MASKTYGFTYKNIPKQWAVYIVLVAIALMFFGNNNIQQYATSFLGLEDFNTNVKGVNINGVEEVTVATVSDGDTITLTDGRRVRYLNIDTPESVKSGTEIQCYAISSSERNKELVSGQTVYLTRDKGNQDIYGRELAFVFLNKDETSSLGNSVNAQLVKEGYARTMFYSPNTTYKETFKEWEEDAQAQNKGLWGSCKGKLDWYQ